MDTAGTHGPAPAPTPVTPRVYPGRVTGRVCVAPTTPRGPTTSRRPAVPGGVGTRPPTKACRGLLPCPPTPHPLYPIHIPTGLRRPDPS